jgi:hypothetical protein
MNEKSEEKPKSNFRKRTKILKSLQKPRTNPNPKKNL